ncbi:tripartite tricarboxylate transporter substrate binding protein [Aestuariirhabdus sp. Z084]|uniref:tripartite tricarboxylate transporter substrate binding protein n=1 Tax=Aestuariirhabdus haliotis TaxID=2918751 RepID=UPI00201B3861|nr:tripartite tricarboxylate transporter substrate-binding protein [Aestuariirhabdus haliotis]MCL6414412.1 tripartite tricarboxylate transporter substrate binding protein [Aestuariirhabdus haliotis]MCL6418344.1 tripartite tricarboxylate transporter substrate binding protein [Aestuariirhabdus haliotis]
MLNLFKRKRVSLMAAALVGCLSASSSMAASQVVDKVHFLIPGGAGGGWDGTARGTGEALSKSGLAGTVSFENMSGGGGGKAIAHLIETSAQQQGTLMVNSTPIVIRSLSKVFPQSFRDLTPVAATIGDFGALVVPANSKYTSFKQVAEAYLKDPRSVSIAGGSARGSMDHLVAAMAFKAAGGDPRKVKYVPYDAGGKAMAGLLSGETDVLSTGLSEVLAMAEAGQIRILVMTGDERSDSAADVPTLKELGYDASFVNWRGFFGAPGLPAADADRFANMLKEMYATEEWQEVRARYGWTEIYKPGTEFVAFLEQQEQVMGNLMRELGFLK